MRVAVLTLCRDRLDYTIHCFQKLREFAGCDFDHYVLDNGSTDGTWAWLGHHGQSELQLRRNENVGISRGMNDLLDETRKHGIYDFIVKFDNDCELTIPGTLRAACEVAATGHWIVSPHIMGLQSPPAVRTEQLVAGHLVGVPDLIGGIFMCAPASLYEGYRHDETNPIWGMDDVNLCGHWRDHGGEIGYLLDFPANHYETTTGQRERYPEYFERKDREFTG